MKTVQPDPFVAPLSPPQIIADQVAATSAQSSARVLGEGVVSEALGVARFLSGDPGARLEVERLAARAGDATMRQAAMHDGSAPNFVPTQHAGAGPSQPLLPQPIDFTAYRRTCPVRATDPEGRPTTCTFWSNPDNHNCPWVTPGSLNADWHY